MTFTELLNEVYSLTNRPDLIAETKTAVKAATLKMHQKDYFYRDLHETGLSFASPDYVQSIEYTELFPRFRSLKYLRKYSDGAAGKEFSILTPEELIDSYGVDRVDVAYVAGASIEIKSSTQDAYMLIGMYLNPDITEAGYSSWIASAHPYAIVYEAVRVIFKSIGFDEQATQLERLVLEQVADVVRSNILAVGE